MLRILTLFQTPSSLNSKVEKWTNLGDDFSAIVKGIYNIYIEVETFTVRPKITKFPKVIYPGSLINFDYFASKDKNFKKLM